VIPGRRPGIAGLSASEGQRSRNPEQPQRSATDGGSSSVPSIMIPSPAIRQVYLSTAGKFPREVSGQDPDSRRSGKLAALQNQVISK